MILIRLRLQPLPNDQTQFQTIVEAAPGVGHPQCQSPMPFDGKRRTTLLKVLHQGVFDPEQFQNVEEQAWMVEAGWLHPNKDAFDPEIYAYIGQALYKSMFPQGSAVKGVIDQALQAAQVERTFLHIQLEIGAYDTSTLADYPWEMMHDGEEFLAFRQVCFSRSIDWQRMYATPAQINTASILLISSGATDPENRLEHLSDQEQQAIRLGINKAMSEGLIYLKALPKATFAGLRAYLTEHRGANAPHIIHFDGHGVFGRRCNICSTIHLRGNEIRCKTCDHPLGNRQGYLVFETTSEGAHYVSAKEISVLMGDVSSSEEGGNKEGLVSVILSACQSAVAFGGDSIFNGVAQNLIGHGIATTVAMQFPIAVNAATSFTEQFYRSLGQRESLAIAVKHAREAIGVEGNQWYRPVLYLRWQDNAGGQIFEAEPQPTKQYTGEHRERHILLNRVKQAWITDALESQIRSTALIEPNKQTCPEAVVQHWRDRHPSSSEERQTLSADKALIDIFDDLGRSLLLLGRRGTGKTTTLLKLVRSAIDLAEADPKQPIPVVLQLSSWKDHTSIEAWVLEELKAKYHIPKRVGRAWLDKNELLLILDDFEEIEAKFQVAGIKAINQFRQEHGLTNIIVCSGLEQYEVLPVKLDLNAAICLQSLTPDQIDRYVIAGGESFSELDRVLSSDPDLRALAETPSMLSIMSLAYQYHSPQAEQPPIDNHKLVFGTYIDSMFKRIGPSETQPYSRQAVLSWLAWLAQRMLAHEPGMFLIERLQPSWLSTRWQFWSYILSSRLIVVLFGGLPIWLFLVFISEKPISGLLAGLISSLALGVIDGLRFEFTRANDVSHKQLPWWQSACVAVVVGLLFGFIGFRLFGLFPIDLFLCFPFGLILGFKSSRQNITNDIQTVETLSLSWRGVVRGAVGGSILSLIIWLTFALPSGRLGDPIFWLPFFLLGITFGVLRRSVLETKTVPNQGIRLSARNALLTGTIYGLAGGFIFGPFWFDDGVLHMLIFGLIFGLQIGLLASLLNGAVDVLNHYILRTILYFTGDVPWHYARFLNYAHRLIFLDKVGGGYKFVDSMLMKHFSDMRS